MTATVDVKLNNYNYGYIRTPLGIPKLTAGAMLVVGDIFSFSGKNKHGEEMTCRRTYKSFVERTGKSRATVGRALKSAREKELITHSQEKGYVFNLEKADGFLRCPEFIYQEEFKIKKQIRKLLSNECRVYSYIFTKCDNRKNKKKVCMASEAVIAEELGVCEKTVHKAIWILIRAKLIYRPKKDKGINGYKLSKFTLNTKLLRNHGVVINVDHDEEKPVPPAPTAPVELTREAIELYYCEKRQRAEEIADNNRRRAMQNDDYKTAHSYVVSLVFECAKAEEGSDNAKKLQQCYNRAVADRLVILKELGLSEEDLIPQYECKLCNDTGFYLDTGQVCKCFPTRRGI